MSRRAAILTEADLTRAIKAARKCGAGAVEIKPDGTIRVILAPEATVQPGQEAEQMIEHDPKVVL